MVEQTSIRTLVSLETDDKGVQDAQKQLKDVVKSQIELTEAFKRGEKDATQFNQEMAKLVREEKDLVNAIEKATGALAAQAKAEADAAKEAKKFADAQREAAEEAERLAQANTAQSRFDKVSSNVALAGDFESNLRTVGGAAGAFGGGAVEQGVGKVAEIGALIEAIPRLKEAAVGLPGALKAGAAALGPTGLLVAGIGAGLIAIEALWKRSIKDMEKELQALADASAEFVDFAAGGGTSEQAAQLNEESQRRIEFAQKEIANLQDEYADRNFHTWDKIRNDGEQALADQVKAFEESITTEEALIERRSEAIENGELAINEAIAAEQALAAERTQGILTEAQQAGELEAQRLRLADATREQIAAELEGLEIRKASLEAELASLQASGDTSEEVTTRIDQLTESLSFLGEQSAQLEKLRSTAKTDKQVESEKKLAAAREETAKASEKATTSERSTRASRRAGIQTARVGFGALFGFGGSKQKDPEIKKVQDEAQKEQENFQAKLADIEQQARDDRLKQEINYQRQLQDTARNFGDQRVDALAEQNFLALDKLNTDEARAKRDLALDNNRANEDINRQTRQANDRLMQEIRRAQEQRLQIERQGYQQALSDANAFVGGLINLFGRLPNARGGSSPFRTQPRTP